MTADEDVTEFETSPSDAFATLGDETRIAIVEALGEADAPLSFTELRTRVEMADSGQFNYHLSKLLETVVRRTEDGTYELTYAGHRIVGAIHAGTYTRRGSLGTFDLESTCVDCGGSIEATYEDERVTVRCPTCDELLSAFGFPPGGFEGRDRDALTRTFDRWITNIVSMAADGICPPCGGVITGRLAHGSDIESLADEEPVGVRFDCDRCGETITLSVNSYLLIQPAVVAFYHRQGIDLDDTESWNLPAQRTADLSVESTSPVTVTSRIELEGATLEAFVESDLTTRTRVLEVN
ncbi:ArsR/SmtB family transcription factor [Halomontanus rarus]|uniref:ArsR/SmtB family transcription factor n=1 Tax=Halomontanus rarus TaxID=3034020 RepID=UPI0023E8A348|nr:winged helix-turn-helix domain-containing protein [Halovivax sp. TS33]